MTIWNYVTTVLIEEHKWSLQRAASQQPSTYGDNAVFPVSYRKNSPRNGGNYEYERRKLDINAVIESETFLQDLGSPYPVN